VADQAERSVTVAVVTFRRPWLLGRMLASIAALEAPAAGWVRTGTVVIDNDPDGSARATVEAWAAEGNDVRYVVEPEPGISAARNRALAEAPGAFVAFADDDDRVDAAWLRELTRTQTETAADAVVGRAIYEFEDGVPDLVRRAGVFQSVQRAQGEALDHISAGLLLLRRELPFRPVFEPEFGLVGGEDDALARRLLSHGGRVVHAPGAITFVWVEAARADTRSVLRRWTRAGSGLLLMDLAHAPSAPDRLRVRVLGMVRGMVRLVAGSARVAALALTRGRVEAFAACRTPLVGVGMLAAAVGRPVAGYRRKEGTT
jgi:succinoglycan biosynthesis protein ExoM